MSRPDIDPEDIPPIPPRWQAIPTGSQSVILAEMDSVGPDVFVKLSAWTELRDKHLSALRHIVELRRMLNSEREIIDNQVELLRNAAGDYDDARAKLDRLRDAVAPLLDREVVQPFITAWEFDPHRSEIDGEEIHQRLREAWGEST